MTGKVIFKRHVECVRLPCVPQREAALKPLKTAPETNKFFKFINQAIQGVHISHESLSSALPLLHLTRDQDRPISQQSQAIFNVFKAIELLILMLFLQKVKC